MRSEQYQDVRGKDSKNRKIFYGRDVYPYMKFAPRVVERVVEYPLMFDSRDFVRCESVQDIHRASGSDRSYVSLSSLIQAPHRASGCHR
jgi:hypothetical protein